MKKSNSLTEEVRKIQEAMDSNNQISNEGRGCHFIELARHLDAVFGKHQDELLSPMQKYRQGQEMLYMGKSPMPVFYSHNHRQRAKF